MRELEPTNITQGERVEWTRSFSDYPATAWNLVYRFRGPGTGFDVTATADGDAFDAVILAASTANSESGRYRWQAWLTKIGDSLNEIVIAEGWTQLNQRLNPDSTDPIDLRSENKIILDLLDAAIKGQATSNHMMYRIQTPAGEREIRRCSTADLIAARKYYGELYARELAKEQTRKTGKRTRQINVRMYNDR